ncbi:MAG TPA: DHA2 family efflux MFS transporter permease subunit [Armatimonadota bacterium]|jgi:DHA2 family multidrug resistance protein
MVTATQTPPHDEYAEYSGSIRWIILLAIMLGTLMQVVDTSIVNVAVPSMMGNLGATLDQIGWVSTGYIIANVICLPLTGWLSSTFGRKRYLAGSMIMFTVASLFCGMAHSLNMLIFFRILQGIGGAALISTAQATMFEIFPPKQVGMVQAIYGVGLMLGPTIGPTLGGWLTDNYSWPWIFYINLPIGIVASILTILFVHDSPYTHRSHGSVDVVGIGFLAIGLGCLQMVLEKGNREGWFESSLISTLSVLAVIGLVAFVYWELKTPNPAVNLRVLKNRGLAAGSAFAAVLGFALFGGIFVLPVFLQNVRHLTAMQTGMAMLPGALASAAAMMIMGRIINKVSPRTLVTIGSVGVVASSFMLATLTMDTSAHDIMLPFILRGASMGFLFLPLTMATLIGLKGRDIAEGTGLFNLARQLGGSAGIAILATFVDHRTAFHRAQLVEHINMFNPGFLLRFNQYAQGLMAKGMPLVTARQQALSLIDMGVSGQSAILAFNDTFLIAGVIFLVATPLIFLLRPNTPGAKPAGPPHMAE